MENHTYVYKVPLRYEQFLALITWYWSTTILTSAWTSWLFDSTLLLLITGNTIINAIDIKIRWQKEHPYLHINKYLTCSESNKGIIKKMLIINVKFVLIVNICFVIAIRFNLTSFSRYKNTNSWCSNKLNWDLTYLVI